MKKFLLSLLLLPAFYPQAFPVQKIAKISGDRQVGVVGYPLREDFVVQVMNDNDTPAAGEPVVFALVYQPRQPVAVKGGIESAVIGGLTVTDQFGFARARLNIGYPETGDIAVSASARGTLGDPAVFSAVSRSRTWLVTILLGVIGGLGILLFGIFYMNEALQKLAGQKLKEILIPLTRSPFRGVSTGLFVTLFNQSSSATTVLEVSLVSAGLLTFYQTMALTMGAEIGSTITSQLLAFRFSDFAVLIAGIGFYMMVLSQTKKWKNVGEAVFGFGMLFLGMKIMSDMLVPLRDYAPFMELMKRMGNPLFGIGVGLAFTAVIQSSGATAGIVIALAVAGVIDLKQAVLVNLGAQIGTCATVLIASVGHGREGRRVALWHLIHQTAGAFIILPFLTLVTWNNNPLWVVFVEKFTRVFFFTDNLARQIAMAHTLAAVVNCAVFFFFLPQAHKLMLKMLPAKETERPFGPLFIDDNIISTPALALEQARREIVREGEIVADMFADAMAVFRSDDPRMCDTLSLKDIRADILRNAVVPYLTKIAQGYLSEEQSKTETDLLFIASDFEEIGDIIDKNIVPLARKKINGRLKFSEEGWLDILSLHERVLANLKDSIEALRSNDPELARRVAESKPIINVLESEMRRRHVGRLNAGLKETLETSSVHLDIIDHFKRVNSHVAAVGAVLLGEF
jgi:phosphate:Na+ symporter